MIDATTGRKMTMLCEHIERVSCLVFSSDGKLLVSGSEDKSIVLWDVQTGGIIQKFFLHTTQVRSVSISADCTCIASGTDDVLSLWDVQTGECIFKKHGFCQPLVSFSPINSKQLISTSNNAIYQWDINNLEIETIHSHFTNILSIDYPMFAACKEGQVLIQNIESGATVAEFCTSQIHAKLWCFSPDKQLVAVSNGSTIEVWAIFGSRPHLIRRTDIRTNIIAFSSPSSLISEGFKVINFWDICDLGSTPTDPKPATLASALVVSISLQAREGIAITSNTSGVVEIWDLLTGFCKSSFQSPATEHQEGDAKLINGNLIFAWTTRNAVRVWESGKNETSETMRHYDLYVRNLRVSANGSHIFWEDETTVRVWSIQTKRKIYDIEKVERGIIDPFCPDGSKIWVRFKDFSIKEWDFGVSNSPTPLSITSSERLCLKFGSDILEYPALSWIENTVTGNKVFALFGVHKFHGVHGAKWDGQYLVFEDSDKGILILDFGHLCS